MSRWQRVRLHIEFAALALGDWILRWIFAQHNARVIVDFENRLASVIYAATGGMMSKPYYDVDVMLAEIEQARSAEYDLGYAEGRKDGLEEQSQPYEMVVFSSVEQAREAGFAHTGEHPVHRHIMAWWPAMGVAGLICRPLRRVTFRRAMRGFCTSEGSLEALLRCRQLTFGDDAIWIEV